MRLNLGSGLDRREGWLNVDKAAAASPDQVADLERFPWPWPDDSVDEALFRHSLEHLGGDPEVYLGIFRELWRVCRDGAIVRIVAPHPRHDTFLSDPTHVRPITPQGLELFSRRKNLEWREKGLPNTPLALYLGVDFELVSVNMTPDEPWRGRLERREITPKDLAQAMRLHNNVIIEMTVELRCVKPAGA